MPAHLLDSCVLVVPRRPARRDKPFATGTADIVLLVFTIVVTAVLLWRGIEAVSFLGGLWIGATIIQLYFHQYHRPVSADRAAPPETSPLKQMSYAIQDAHWRAWPHMATMSVLVAVSLVLMF